MSVDFSSNSRSRSSVNFSGNGRATVSLPGLNPIGWRWDATGRYLQSDGVYGGTTGATITKANQFSTPFVGSVPIDMRLGVGNTYTYNGVGNAYVNYQINSWSKANGNVWAVGVAGTSQALTADAKAWGVVGVGHASVAGADAHAAEFDICTSNTIGGDFDNAYGVGIGAGASGSGIPSHAKAYMYWAQVGGDNAVQHGLLLRDSSHNPLKTSASIITTGFNAGQGGSAHLSVTHGINLLNTTVSGNVIQHGTGSAALSYMSGGGGIGFTGNAGLYAITSGGTSRRVLDTDPTPSLVRLYGPDGSTPHVQLTDTQVYIDCTTLNLRNNSGDELGIFNSTGLAISPSNSSALLPDTLLTLSNNAGAIPANFSGGLIHLVGADSGGGAGLAFDTFGISSVVAGRRANNTAASPTALAAEDAIWTVSIRGHTGSAYTTGNQGTFAFWAAETWTTGVSSTYFQIGVVPTTTNGNSSPLLKAMYVGNNTVPRVGIGNFNAITPSYSLSFANNVARTIGIERRSAGAGGGLTISADAAASGGSNLAGGPMAINAGVSTGNVGSTITFGTSTPGSSGTSDNTVSTKLTIDGPGNIVPGSGALATTATDGFLYIPTCAGTPTGVPTAYSGRVPIVFDTTNNKLYIYDGGWLGGTAPGAWS